MLPPSLRGVAAGGSPGLVGLESVAELDLGAFYAAYRDDGWGAAAHDPQMMVALLVYASPLESGHSYRVNRAAMEKIGNRRARFMHGQLLR